MGKASDVEHYIQEYMKEWWGSRWDVSASLCPVLSKLIGLYSLKAQFRLWRLVSINAKLLPSLSPIAPASPGGGGGGEGERVAGSRSSQSDIGSLKLANMQA